MTPTRHSGFDVMQAGQLKQLRTKRWAMSRFGMGLGMLGMPTSAFAQSADPLQWHLHMGRGVTTMSNHAHDAPMIKLWICLVIGSAFYSAIGPAISALTNSDPMTVL